MKLRLVIPVVTMVLIGAPVAASAQTVSAQVALQVPVNLTQFGPDVAKVQVSCTIRSDAITTSTSYGRAADGRLLYGSAAHEAYLVQELPMTGGQLTSTTSLAFSFAGLENPVGKNAAIWCTLMGWSTSQAAWVQFTGGATNVSFKTSGGSGGGIDGAFVW